MHNFLTNSSSFGIYNESFLSLNKTFTLSKDKDFLISFSTSSIFIVTGTLKLAPAMILLSSIYNLAKFKVNSPISSLKFIPKLFPSVSKLILSLSNFIKSLFILFNLKALLSTNTNLLIAFIPSSGWAACAAFPNDSIFKFLSLTAVSISKLFSFAISSISLFILSNNDLSFISILILQYFGTTFIALFFVSIFSILIFSFSPSSLLIYTLSNPFSAYIHGKSASGLKPIVGISSTFL